MARARREVPWLDTHNGVWHAFWYDVVARQTRRLSLRTRDAAEATARFSAFLAEGRGVLYAVGPVGLSVEQALNDYLREHARPNAANAYRQEQAARHLVAHFGQLALKDVDIPACRSYAEARRTGAIGTGKGSGADKRGSDATIRRELNVLVAASNHAILWKRLSRNEAPTFELPTENSAGAAAWLTRGELAKAIRAAPKGSVLRDFILLAYYTGSRCAAIETLTKAQVDVQGRTIALAKPGERKTKKRRPIVPIFAPLRGVLRRRLAASGSDLVLGQAISSYMRFNRHMAALGMADKANPHVLRHSRATHLLQRGEKIYAVAKLLGDTVATVERVYGHHSPEFLEDLGRRR